MPDTRPGRKSIATAAWANAITHGLAATAMLIWIVPALPTGEVGAADRMRWVAAHRVEWIAAWLLWHPAALSLAWLLGGLLRETHRHGMQSFRWIWHVSVAALICGVASDLAGQWVFIRSASVDMSATRFGALQDWGGQLTGLLANGLYTVALAGIAVFLW